MVHKVRKSGFTLFLCFLWKSLQIQSFQLRTVAMLRVVLVLLLEIAVSAFIVVPGRGFLCPFVDYSAKVMSSRLYMGEVYFDNNCEQRLKDENGRCPGESGYKAQVQAAKPEDSSFAAFQKAMALKKKSAADALKKGK